jgi:hypothetical protein
VNVADGFFRCVVMAGSFSKVNLALDRELDLVLV